MGAVYLTRKATFAASHRYYDPRRSEEENERLFGRCVRLHGHNYVLAVTVTGEVDETTGMAVDLKELKEVIEAAVVRRFHTRHLNDDPEFQDRIPTTENLARVIWRLLKPRLHGCQLHRITLHEDPTLYVEYYGE